METKKVDELIFDKAKHIILCQIELIQNKMDDDVTHHDRMFLKEIYRISRDATNNSLWDMDLEKYSSDDIIKALENEITNGMGKIQR